MLNLGSGAKRTAMHSAKPPALRRGNVAWRMLMTPTLLDADERPGWACAQTAPLLNTHAAARQLYESTSS